MRRLTPRRSSQREREQQRTHQPCDPQRDLREDERRDTAVGAHRDRPGGVERDVRGQRREHLQVLLGITGSHLLVGRELHLAERSPCQPGRARRGQVVHEPPRLHELAPCQPRRGRQPGLVVVAVDLRRDASVDQRIGAARAGCRRSWRDRPGRRVCTRITSRTYRSASVRWRPAISTTVARWRERDVSLIESATLTAENRANIAMIAMIMPRPRVANGRNDEGCRITGRPGGCACRRGSARTCCRRARSGPVRGAASSCAPCRVGHPRASRSCAA